MEPPSTLSTFLDQAVTAAGDMLLLSRDGSAAIAPFNQTRLLLQNASGPDFVATYMQDTMVELADFAYKMHLARSQTADGDRQEAIKKQYYTTMFYFFAMVFEKLRSNAEFRAAFLRFGKTPYMKKFRKVWTADSNLVPGICDETRQLIAVLEEKVPDKKPKKVKE